MGERPARDFAAWLGLTPKDHSTGGRQRLGGITKAGDFVLRSTLIIGATELLRHVRKVRGVALADIEAIKDGDGNVVPSTASRI
jgi:transposase